MGFGKHEICCGVYVKYDINITTIFIALSSLSSLPAKKPVFLFLVFFKGERYNIESDWRKIYEKNEHIDNNNRHFSIN